MCSSPNGRGTRSAAQQTVHCSLSPSHNRMGSPGACYKTSSGRQTIWRRRCLPTLPSNVFDQAGIRRAGGTPSLTRVRENATAKPSPSVRRWHPCEAKANSAGEDCASRRFSIPAIIQEIVQGLDDREERRRNAMLTTAIPAGHSRPPLPLGDQR
jgi:hypothetical protein